MTCSIDGCTGPAWVRGWCIAHYARWRRHGDPLGERRPAIHIEDVEWMAETGETWAGVCRRLKFSSERLERGLQRAGRHDLISQLGRYEPALQVNSWPPLGLIPELRGRRMV